MTRVLPARLKGYWRNRTSVKSRPGQSIAFRGDYSCWADAEWQSTGYGTPAILERTCESLLKIKRGEAVYERDSVLFDRPEYSFPVLSALLRAGLLAGGRISVADFGGSLGSTYFQLRPFLSVAEALEWNVIEQPAYVSCGRTHFEDGDLRFYETLEECLVHHRPDVLLLSSVIQYMPDPYGTLEQLLQHRLRHVVIDRTAFLTRDQDRLTVQTVPEWIYPASYPAWFLSETRLTRVVAEAGYALITDFPGADTISPVDEPAYFKGFIYEQRSA